MSTGLKQSSAGSIVLITVIGGAIGFWAHAQKSRDYTWPSANESAPSVRVVGDVLRFSGPINRHGIEVLNGLPLATVKTLEITSPGGNERASIELGEFVRSGAWNVEVRKYCLSGCASYVFPMAQAKTIHDGAIVGCHNNVIAMMHLGTFSTPGNEWSPEERERQRRAQALYKAAGIQEEFPLNCFAQVVPFCVQTQSNNGALQRGVKTAFDFWVPLGADWEKFGVRGIQGAPLRAGDVAEVDFLRRNNIVFGNAFESGMSERRLQFMDRFCDKLPTPKADVRQPQ
jgi:hypothetical protein